MGPRGPGQSTNRTWCLPRKGWGKSRSSRRCLQRMENEARSKNDGYMIFWKNGDLSLKILWCIKRSNLIMSNHPEISRNSRSTHHNSCNRVLFIAIVMLDDHGWPAFVQRLQTVVEKPWCHYVEPEKKRKAHVVGQKRTTKNMSDTGYKCSWNIHRAWHCIDGCVWKWSNSNS